MTSALFIRVMDKISKRTGREIKGFRARVKHWTRKEFFYADYLTIIINFSNDPQGIVEI